MSRPIHQVQNKQSSLWAVRQKASVEFGRISLLRYRKFGNGSAKLTTSNSAKITTNNSASNNLAIYCRIIFIGQRLKSPLFLGPWELRKHDLFNLCFENFKSKLPTDFRRQNFGFRPIVKFGLKT